jgi:hypothetical protein
MPQQYTPGPWYVAMRPEYDVDYITADRIVGGPTGHDEYDSELGVYAVIDDEPETLARPWKEADARLIAAAPDLLQALGPDEPCPGCDGWKLANQVIARVEGRTWP